MAEVSRGVSPTSPATESDPVRVGVRVADEDALRHNSASERQACKSRRAPLARACAAIAFVVLLGAGCSRTELSARPPGACAPDVPSGWNRYGEPERNRWSISVPPGWRVRYSYVYGETVNYHIGPPGFDDSEGESIAGLAMELRPASGRLVTQFPDFAPPAASEFRLPSGKVLYSRASPDTGERQYATQAGRWTVFFGGQGLTEAQESSSLQIIDSFGEVCP